MSPKDDESAAVIDALWDRADPASSELRFRDALRSPDIDDDARVELSSQLARAIVLQGRPGEALTVLDEVGAGIDGRSRRARVRWLLERGRALASAVHSDDPVAALAHYEAAWQLAVADDSAADGTGADDLAVDAAHMASIVSRDPTDKARWLDAALALSASSAEPAARRWRASLLNNLGMLQHDQGDDEAALASFRDALDARLDDGAAAVDVFVAHWMVAWALRLTGEHEAALVILWRLRSEGDERGDPDPYVFEELGENLRALGRDVEAAAWSERARLT